MTDDTLPLDLPPGPWATKSVEDETGAYRYMMSRVWAPGTRIATFVMHHPSTDDEFRDSATIKRCLAFAKALDCESMIVLNLYALRVTHEDELAHHEDPIGPENDAWLKREFVIARALANPLIAAWGEADPERVAAVLELPGADRFMSLGTSRDGAPLLPRRAPERPRLRPFPAVSEG